MFPGNSLSLSSQSFFVRSLSVLIQLTILLFDRRNSIFYAVCAYYLSSSLYLKKNFLEIAHLVEWVLKVRGWIRFSGSGPVLVPISVGMAGGALFELWVIVAGFSLCAAGVTQKTPRNGLFLPFMALYSPWHSSCQLKSHKTQMFLGVPSEGDKQKQQNKISSLCRCFRRLFFLPFIFHTSNINHHCF